MNISFANVKIPNRPNFELGCLYYSKSKTVFCIIDGIRLIQGSKHEVQEASYVANFNTELSDPMTTSVAPGKMSNTIVARFNVQSDNLKLANIRSHSNSGLGTVDCGKTF